MSRFIGQLKTRSLFPYEIKARGLDLDVQIYELLEDFGYYSDRLKVTVTAPAGMTTDFASIPRLIENILPHDHPYIEMPSVPHDLIYGLGGKLSNGVVLTREDADVLLREAMELQGAGSFVRNTVYQILRRFGGGHWKTK